MLDRLLREVFRRRLLQAAGTYAIVCWFLVQIAATTMSLFGLPQWTVRAALAVSLLGLPVVLGAAWLFGARRGARRVGMAPAPGSQGATAEPALAGATSTGLSVVLISLALLGGAAWIYRAQRGGAGASPGVEASAKGDGSGTAEAPAHTVAVLPFTTLSEHRDDAYFSDGVTEEIMNAVAQVPGVSVVARSSSFAFRDHPDLDEIREQLGAGSVLEGSVRRAGDRVRVDVALVDTRTQRRVWAAGYDRGLRDIFALEDEIAGAVATALQVELTSPPSHSIGTESVPAHDLYLLGLYHWNRRTGPEIRQAVAYFGRAAEADPSYARAYAGLASSYVLLPLYAAVPGDDAYPRARVAAEKALALDGDLAEARTALANVLMIYGWDWSGADAEFRRAIALDSSYATAHEWRGLLLDAVGRHDEAGEEFRRARAADPASLIIAVATGLHEALLDRQDAAAETYRRVLARQPDLPIALSFLAQSESMLGHADSARAALHRWAVQMGVEPSAAESLATGVADPVARPAARRALAGGALQRTFKPFEAAVWASLLGDTARAITSLERGAADHDYLTFSAAVHPAFRTLRGSQRYRALLVRMGLR